ncbi:hypothetical protein [Aeromonas media]|uniref:hypothetical protein n=1 Tax=Aeromonas media TaxID=651 RepID=UPI00295308BD|nr:hypothetical protein [Aeromonas media]WOQ12720.1 hypothetical protein R2X36_17855 [Aeromonas media]
MSFKYSQEAKKRISALGQSVVTEFIDEIPQIVRKIIYKRLPPVQGFRKDTPLEFKEKQKRLIGHLNHFQAGSKGGFDWEVFSLLWEGWIRDQFGEKIPNDSCSNDGAIFLNEFANSYPNASREDVERLFLFSGFPDHLDVTTALGLFRSSAVLARDRMLDELPSRQGKLEERLGITKIAIEDVSRRIGRLEKTSEKLAKNVEEAAKGVDRNVNTLTLQKGEFDAVLVRYNTITGVVDELCSVEKKHAKAISVTDAKVKILDQAIDKLVTRGNEWDAAASELTVLKAIVAALSAQEAKWNKTVETVGVLAEQVVALERILVEGSAGGGTRQQARLLERKSEAPVVDIYSIEDACTLITTNLQAVGVTKGKALVTSRQIVAALIAGQLIQFSGSISDLIADAVAAAVSGPIYHEWRVPVGLVSDDAASSCVETVIQSSNCLLLKGANLSAFEVYGTSIRDIVMRRPFIVSDYGHITLIASWNQGPAAFPDGGLLAELGPVFDTDEFQMRGLLAKRPQLQFGRLAKDAWGLIDGLEVNEHSYSVDEFRDLLNEADFKGSNLWRQVVNHAYVVLQSMPGGTPAIDHHSLLVAWAVPYAKAIGGPVDKLSQLAEHELEANRTGVVA